MKFNIGDKVLIKRNLISGCYGAAGKTGFITKEKNTNGLLYNDNGINVKIENSHQIWKVNEDALEIIEHKPFKKEDLKDGMVVEDRNGCRRMKMGSNFIPLQGYHIELDSYEDNLICKNCHDFDIMKIYDDRKIYYEIEVMITNSKNCIYERKESITKDISLEEINTLLKEKYPDVEKFNLPIDNDK